MTRAAALTTLAASALMAACGSTGTSSAAAPAPAPTAARAEAWVTTGDRTRLLQADEQGPAWAVDDGSAADVVVDDTRRYQEMVGFGASITDASAYLLNQRLNATQRAALLRELFGRGAGGLGFHFTRLTIGASDFSSQHYSLDDRPPGTTDPSLQFFSIDSARADLLPVMHEVLAINPALQVMASPWSAPAWMKSTDSLIKGALKPEHYDAFARYLVRYVDAFAAEGVPVFALTVQNEPLFEPGDYPGMFVDAAARAALVGRYLGPLLEQRGLKVQIIEWDHNWDNTQQALTVLADPVARRYISGVGWHCYAGDVSAQSVVHDAHPDKDTWFTECSGGEWKTNWAETLPWLARNIVIGSTRHWARGVLMWNLALDERFGPHNGGCPNCRGVVTIDAATGAVTRNMEYYALGHASRFVRPGARRIDTPPPANGLDTVAFRNADDGSLVLILCNSTAQSRTVSVRHGGRRLNYTMPRESLVTLTWTP